MNLFANTQSNGFGGELISLGIVDDQGRSFYAVLRHDHLTIDPWVKEHVIPALGDVPHLSDANFRRALHAWLMHYKDELHFITNWPDHIRFIAQYLVTGPNSMISIAHPMRFTVDTSLSADGSSMALNAAHDAFALRHNHRSTHA